MNFDQYGIHINAHTFKIFMIQIQSFMTDSLKSHPVTSEDEEQKLQKNENYQTNQDSQVFNPQQQNNQTTHQNAKLESKQQNIDAKKRKNMRKKAYRKRKNLKQRQKEIIIHKFKTLIIDIYQSYPNQMEKAQIIQAVIEMQPNYDKFCQLIDRGIKTVQLTIKTCLDIVILKPCIVTNEYNFEVIEIVFNMLDSIYKASQEISRILVRFIKIHKSYEQLRYHPYQLIYEYLKKMLIKRSYRYLFLFDDLQLKSRLMNYFTALMNKREPEYQYYKLSIPIIQKLIYDSDMYNSGQGDIRMIYFKQFNNSAYEADDKFFKMSKINAMKVKVSKQRQIQEEKIENYNGILGALEDLNITQDKRQSCAVSQEWLKKIQNKITK